MVVILSLLFYYFILTFKKLTPQLLWKYYKNVLCQYNYVCTYKYLKEKTKRAQAKPTYGGKKKKEEGP